MTSAKEWANLLWRHAWVSEGDVQAIMDASRAQTLEEAAQVANTDGCWGTAERIRALAASPKPRDEITLPPVKGG